MSDARFIEGGREWPRRYTPVELKTLESRFKAAGVEKLSLAIVRKLQKAAQEFQWAMSADPGGIFFRSNKEKRYKLKRILKLYAANRPTKKIELALRGLDGPTLQRLGSRIHAGHPRLPAALRRVLKTIPSSGPDPERSHRQFIARLERIVASTTGERPARRVHEERCGRFSTQQKDYGPFLELVKAAVRPFDPTRDCEWDIRAVLHQRKKRDAKRKTDVAAEG